MAKQQQNASALAHAIENRVSDLCREMVRREGLLAPDHIAAQAMRQAIDEHVRELARYPALAETYDRDIARAEERTRALDEVQERARAHDRIIEGLAREDVTVKGEGR